ncbi:hypothetical protein PAXINDRAFT_9253 [Paxillus involutus ATCC 200175]|nr:hypothetical protein PAXINDRAFT_9253 [Paxillus involutus ATCC 200175]
MDDYGYFADLATLEDDDPCDSNCDCASCSAAPSEIDIPYDARSESEAADEDEDEDVPSLESGEAHFKADASSADEGQRLPREPIQRARTRGLKARLAGQDIATKVANILAFITNEGMDLPLFLNALFLGHPDCHTTGRDATYRYARHRF